MSACTCQALWKCSKLSLQKSGEAANWKSGATSINHTVILAALYETRYQDQTEVKI